MLGFSAVHKVGSHQNGISNIEVRSTEKISSWVSSQKKVYTIQIDSIGIVQDWTVYHDLTASIKDCIFVPNLPSDSSICIESQDISYADNTDVLFTAPAAISSKDIYVGNNFIIYIEDVSGYVGRIDC